jgi:ceramide glucosyltransferase
VLERLVAEFSSFDTRIFVEDEDPYLQTNATNTLGPDALGPNPKVRSMSRAYREAKGDLLWIIDCNVWVAKGVCGRMVDTLLGRGNTNRPQKLVHQLPLVVDTEMSSTPETQSLLHSAQFGPSSYSTPELASTSTHITESFIPPRNHRKSILKTKGGRLEELFMSSSHAKFYTAINTVLVAPCLVGKSNMFRRSHLDVLTNGQGLNYFSHNICEDHLIGDLLWKRPVPRKIMGDGTVAWGNHAILFGDLAIQPMANMSVREYVARRVRWLRVRKYTVLLATLVEATTESFFCSVMLSYGLTTVPYVHETFHIPQTWAAFCVVWLLSVSTWAMVDWTLYQKLHSGVSIDMDANTPPFARPNSRGGTRRPFLQWLCAWLGREGLAFPIWFWAVFGGATVTWRGKSFWVDMNMKVHEIVDKSGSGVIEGRKARRD